MSNGRLKIEVLTSGAIVKPNEILDAVNKGVVDSGQWWTHYATGKHPAGGLFSAPLGGSGSGLDQMGQLAWYMRGGGRELYLEYYTEDAEGRRDAVPVRARRPRVLRLVQEAGHVGGGVHQAALPHLLGPAERRAEGHGRRADEPRRRRS